MQIVEYNSLSALDGLEDDWDRLAKQGLYFVPSFSELRGQLQANQSNFRVLATVDNSQVTAMACFIYENGFKRYYIGARKLFNLPVHMATLFGSCVIGLAGEDAIREFFRLIIKDGGFDLIDVGYIFVETPLYKAIKSLRGAIAWRVVRKKQFWWLIQLPGSFDEYFASLRDITRFHIARDCRKFERRAPIFRIMTLPDEVDIFLRDADEISRSTYQWKLTYGLQNDESTRQHFVRLAKSGNLRCYITYLHGEPCAFGWGDLVHGKFYFRQTGFNPKFRNLSPGTALMIKMIRDLIENTNCQVFHFQWGGEDGYKSRLSTSSLSCSSMQAVPIYRPYSLLVATLDQMLNLAKNSVGLVVERGPLKERLRSVLRRYGVATF